MKKLLLIALTATLLLTISASCSRRGEHEGKLEGQTTVPDQSNGETSAGITDPSVQDPPVDTPTWGEGNPYEGNTKEELLSMYENASEWALGTGFNTPYYVILHSQIHNGCQVFSRLTGQIEPLCRDALCDHEACIFKRNTRIMALTVTEDRIYMVISEPVTNDEQIRNKISLYSFDFMFDDSKLIREWGTTGDGPQNNILLNYGGRLFYVDNYYHDSEVISTTYVLDPETGASELLWGEEFFVSVWDVEGDYVYYQDSTRRTVSRYHMVKKTHETVLQDMLDPEHGDIFCALSDVVGDRLICSMISMVETYSFIYNIATGEMESTMKTAGTLCEDRIFYFKDHTDEVYKDDPFYDYYLRQPGELYEMDNISGGEIWMRSFGGEETLLVYLTTYDIPDNITICGFDGRFLYVHVHRYLDYQNELNPNFNPFNTKEYIACIDTQTDTVYQLLKGYKTYTES